MYGGVTSSGLKIADAQISTLRSMLHTLIVNPTSAGVGTVTVYDSENSSVSGKLELMKIVINSTDQSNTAHLTEPVNANRGIYIVATGTDISYIAHYTLA